MKEYKDFLEFYNKSLELSKIAKNTINNSKGAILYARKSFNMNCTRKSGHVFNVMC